MTVHSPVCVVRTHTLLPHRSGCYSSFVQWLVASFLTWHSLHGKPVILDGNLALHCYHVTALLVYLIQGNNASLFFIFLYFFLYNPRATYFQGLHTFFVSSIYIIVTFSVSVLKKTLCTLYSILFYRAKEKARHLLMSCSFFLVCHWEVFLVALQFVIIYKAGECSSEEEVYILIGVYRCKTVLGGNSRQQLNCNHNQSCHLT